MHRYLRYGYLEDLDTVPHLGVGRLWGVRISRTPLSWLYPLTALGIGLLMRRGTPPEERKGVLRDTAVNALALAGSLQVHSLGHLLSGKLVGSPMDELLITNLREVTYYHGDQERYPWHVHVGRALGGPLASLGLAGLSIAAAKRAPAGFWRDLLTAVGNISRGIGFGTLAPVPESDGIVIARELARALRRQSRVVSDA